MAELPNNLGWEIKFLLDRNLKVVESNCFKGDHPLLVSAIGELAINLREIIVCFEKALNFRMRANHDLGVSGATDVANLISRLRHSYAHSSTTKVKDLDDRDNRISWGFVWGKMTAIQINDKIIGNEYADDFGVMFGDNVVLFKRHILLAHNFFAHAFNYTAPNDIVQRALIFRDSTVLQHEFWTGGLNDLPKLGWEPHLSN